MIIKNRGTLCKMRAPKKPMSSVPKKESSIHLDLQVLYTKKNMLESTAKIWESKIDSIHHELSKVNREINEIESYANQTKGKTKTGGTVRCKPDNIINDTANNNKIKIVEVEY